jgi:hypothetical protein
MSDRPIVAVKPDETPQILMLPGDVPLGDLTPRILLQTRLKKGPYVLADALNNAPLPATATLDSLGIGPSGVIVIRYPDQALRSFGPVEPLDPQTASLRRQQRRSRRVRRMVRHMMVIAVVAVAAIGGFLYWQDRGQGAAEAMGTFLDASLEGRADEAANLTCEAYRDQLALTFHGRSSGGIHLEYQTVWMLLDRATVEVRGQLSVRTHHGHIRTVDIDDRFEMRREDGRWLVCDEKLANGIWGYR